MTTKTGNLSYVASGSNTAGGTTNGALLDMSTAQSAGFTMKITNGATAPTVPCQAIVQVTPDGGTTYENYRTYTAGLNTSTAYSFPCDVPRHYPGARVQFTGNTGQAVTVEAQSYIMNTA